MAIGRMVRHTTRAAKKTVADVTRRRATGQARAAYMHTPRAKDLPSADSDARAAAGAHDAAVIQDVRAAEKEMGVERGRGMKSTKRK